MSGHSKWANIKRRKGAVDAKKGQLYTRIARDITIAAKEGGGDVNSNPSLRAAVEKAKSQNMPKANIQKAIDRGTGNLEGVQIVEAQYEGYASGGVAVLIHCLTDNKNRTVSDIRSAFKENGGSVADAGSVAYIFSGSEPSFRVPLSDSDLEKFSDLIDNLDEIDEVMNVSHNLQEDE